MLNERNTLLEDDGIEEEILVEEECSVAQAVWGDIHGNIENQTDLKNALDAKQDSLTEAQLNAVNSGITAGKVTTYDGYADQIASKANQSALNAEATAREQADTALGTRIDNEALARQQADNGLQSQIDAITSKSDVVDVVANYAALQAYDTSTLGNNDVIKVLDDETHEDALTYYRWSTTTQTWTYIGQEAPYYSKGQMDVKLAEKQDKLTAGDNIQIQNGTISATNTTYTAGNGLNLNGTEFSADTTVLATKSDLESYYTKPETDNLLAPKLEAEVVAELPTTGEEGKLYLTPKAHTTQTATGNPITATVSEDAGKIESFQLDGDTFQQIYTGKNLFNKANVVNGIPSASDGSITSTTSVGRTSDYIPVTPNTTYSHTGHQLGWATVAWYKSDKSFIERTDNVTTTTSPNEAAYARVSCAQGNLDTCQFEIGQPTAYEPYVGGQPSPNPDYPQQIQTVTGTQTISINGTDYPIDLGDIQLCGFGDDGSGNPLRKDRIYKNLDDDKWHIAHMTSRHTFDGSSPDVYIFNADQTKTLAVNMNPSGIDQIAFKFSSDEVISAYCQNLKYIFDISDVEHIYITGAQQTAEGYYGNIRCYIDKSRLTGYSPSMTNSQKVDIFKTYLSNNPMDVVFMLKTPTDTTITDTTLIAQLEAIRTASLENGANTITNSATGSNLAGDMEIGYYGFNPRNRYDKWLWLDINNEYEQIGS